MRTRLIGVVVTAVLVAGCGGGGDDLVLSSSPPVVSVADGSPSGTNTSALLTRLDAATRDVSILFVGDSTGNQFAEWIGLATTALAARYPAYRASFHSWDEERDTWREPRLLQDGYGAVDLDIWNLSIAGATTSTVLGARYPALLATNPDQIVISLGKNHGRDDPGLVRSAMLSLSEGLGVDLPGAAISLVLQMPNRDDDAMAAVNDVYRDLAIERGYGLFDVAAAFDAAPDRDALFLDDGIHPTTAADGETNGSQLWADTVLSAIDADFAQGITSRQQPANVVGPGDDLMVNGDFGNVGDDGVPVGWTADDVKVRPEQRSDRLAGAIGRPVRVAVSGAARGALGYRWPTASLDQIRGERITAAVRVWVDEGQPPTAGRIGLADDASFVTSRTDAAARGGYHWRIVTFDVAADATYVKLRLFADTSDAGTAEVTFDRAIVVVGDQPKLAPTPRAA